jgi:uncharacterized protein YcaQ
LEKALSRSVLQGAAISIAEARRIAIGAQQFASGKAQHVLKSTQSVASAVRKLGVLQIDSVNALVRSHYLPLFSRYGQYDSQLLDRAAFDHRLLFEYWGHEASFLPIEHWPLLQWRMQAARRGEGTWGRLRRYATEHKDAVDAVRRELRERGPLGAGDLTAAERAKGGWWGWSQSKEILEWLFWIGEVSTARRRNFERLYDLTERVIPASIFQAPTPSKEESQRALLTIASQALGVATVRDLRDYFRLPVADAAARLRELVDANVLLPVAVEGWAQQGYLHVDAKRPRRVDVAALLSPFDSLIWERQRTERLFDFHFRLEIYTPLHKRVHGYYVLPFLLGDRIVGRVDLKSDRASSRLLVKGGSAEEGVDPAAIVEALAGRLCLLATWLGLEKVAVTTKRGELMKVLKQQRLRPE